MTAVTSEEQMLLSANLRPTKQRIALTKALFDKAPRHVTAEELYCEVRQAGMQVSLATVYNTLHQFTEAGLMREVVVGSGQSYFDTTPHSHFHFFDKSTGEIFDIPEDAINFDKLPAPPPGKVIDRVDVVVRVKSTSRRNS